MRIRGAQQAVETLFGMLHAFNTDLVLAANEAMDACMECSEWAKVCAGVCMWCVSAPGLVQRVLMYRRCTRACDAQCDMGD